MPTQVLILHFECATISRASGEALSRWSNSTPSSTAKTPNTVIAGVEVIMGLGHHIPPALIAKAKTLKWVQALTTGTETLTAPGVLPPHVLLTSTRGIHGPQMSELALSQHDRARPRLSEDAAQPGRGQMGAMGSADPRRQDHRHRRPRHRSPSILAERCKLFGMNVIGVSGGRAKAPHFDEVHPRTELVKLAARADFLMLLVPYSKETHHLINRDVLAAMKPTAFLINLARGGVLDEAALIEHLQAGKIAGAGIDIFSKMPLPPDNPLWRMPNVIITPNIGGRSDKFVEQTMTVLEPNLQAFIDGRLKDLRNLVAH